MLEILTDAHKAWLRLNVMNHEQLIADLEQNAASGDANLEQLMSMLYLNFGIVRVDLPTDKDTKRGNENE